MSGHAAAAAAAGTLAHARPITVAGSGPTLLRDATTSTTSKALRSATSPASPFLSTLMSVGSLPQAEADALLAMEKRCTEDTPQRFPDGGGSLVLPLVSADQREQFFLDIRRRRVDISKATYQNRARTVVMLARLDLGSQPHRNPDGEEIGSPHLHLYREGFGDKWAYPLPSDFSDPSDTWKTLEEFMQFCNITVPPTIQRGIFT